MTFILIVLGVIALWAGAAVALALLTGEMIHERDVHDRPAARRRRSVAL